MRKQHAAYSRISESDTIVVFVHGIQGSPRQFNYIASNVPKHIDYMCVLLPGHGKTIREFCRSGRKEWIEYFDGICSDLRGRYKRIYFVGHSMGCLIGIDAMIRKTIQFDGMLLMACPLKIRLNVGYVLMCLKTTCTQKSSDSYLRAMQEANSIETSTPWKLFTCMKPYFGLASLIFRVRTEIRHLNAKVCIIQSDCDEIVSSRTIRISSKIRNCKVVIAPNSGHFYYSSEANSIICRELCLLMAEPTLLKH